MDSIERTFELIIGLLSIGLGFLLGLLVRNQLLLTTYRETCLDIGGRISGSMVKWSDCVIRVGGSRVNVPPPDAEFANVVFVVIILACWLGAKKIMQSMKSSYGVDGTK